MEILELTPPEAVSLLVERVRTLVSPAGHRIVIGIAGGPGAGKSTIAGEVVASLNETEPGSTALVPMDGFHMRHAKLESLGLVGEKGAAHTFEGAAFAEFLGRLKAATSPLSGPGYSRQIEDVVEDAFVVDADVKILIVEGNYLLLPEPPWDAVRPLLDLAVFIDLPRDYARARLLRRHGENPAFSIERNIRHVEEVDLANFALVARTRERADIAIDLRTLG